MMPRPIEWGKDLRASGDTKCHTTGTATGQSTPATLPPSAPPNARWRGVARVPRAGVADKRSPEGGAQAGPSERRPRRPKRASGDGTRATPKLPHGPRIRKAQRAPDLWVVRRRGRQKFRRSHDAIVTPQALAVLTHGSAECANALERQRHAISRAACLPREKRGFLRGLGVRLRRGVGYELSADPACPGAGKRVRHDALSCPRDTPNGHPQLAPCRRREARRAGA